MPEDGRTWREIEREKRLRRERRVQNRRDIRVFVLYFFVLLCCYAALIILAAILNAHM